MYFYLHWACIQRTTGHYKNQDLLDHDRNKHLTNLKTFKRLKIPNQAALTAPPHVSKNKCTWVEDDFMLQYDFTTNISNAIKYKKLSKKRSTMKLKINSFTFRMK